MSPAAWILYVRALFGVLVKVESTCIKLACLPCGSSKRNLIDSNFQVLGSPCRRHESGLKTATVLRNTLQMYNHRPAGIFSSLQPIRCAWPLSVPCPKPIENRTRARNRFTPSSCRSAALVCVIRISNHMSPRSSCNSAAIQRPGTLGQRLPALAQGHLPCCCPQ